MNKNDFWIKVFLYGVGGLAFVGNLAFLVIGTAPALSLIGMICGAVALYSGAKV